MSDYNLKNIYQGGYSSLDPDSGFKGYRVSAGKVGLAMDFRTANILQEASTKLGTGAKQVEVSTFQPEVFESIPNEQLKEVRRLSELTGVDVSLHGIMVEPSGITQQGFSELSREETERQMISNVLRSHDLSPKGNIPVTFHSSMISQGPEYKKTKEGEFLERMPIINQQSGQVNLVKSELRHTLDMSEEELKKGVKSNVQQQLALMNNTEWKDNLANVVQIKERADRMIGETQPAVMEIYKMFPDGKIDPSALLPMQREVLMRYNNAEIELGEVQKTLNAQFERAYKYSDDANREDVRNFLGGLSKNFRKTFYNEDGTPKKAVTSLSEESRALGELLNGLSALPSPKIYKPLEDFALDKTATTFANVALAGYQKFHETAPIVSIENPPAGGVLSHGQDLKNLVEKSREKFVENAKKEGISENEAKEAAEKLIGVTWDVGHINMLRKFGYTEEDVVKQAEKVAPIVKHIHLSDNFGMEHTELPMGMGNVPFKAIMEKLGEKGFEAAKVVEAGNWWQHFKTSPLQQTFEAFGSPIYGIKMQPYWNQAVGAQGYFSGYGQMLPQINYETMGSGFSNLPAELGGQRTTAGRSRMSGSPME